MRPSVAAAYATVALAGCPSPMPPPIEEPMIAAPEAPRIPWLAAGTPDIAPPQIPWLTDESACPAGWGWVEVAPGVNGCDPYPTGRIEDCGSTGAHFPGEAGCRDLDSGDTDWPSDLPATNVLYVLEGASGGDGTRALPFATLPEALAVATEGTTIALGPGRYDTGQGAERRAGVYETLSNILIDGLHIRGTSVARTTLYSARPAPPPMGGDVGMLTVRARDVEVRDLRFESPHPAVDAIGGSIVVSRVVLDGTFLGLFGSEGCTAVFEDVIARNTTGGVLAGSVTGGSVTLRRAVLEGTGGLGVVTVEAASSLVMEDVSVRGYATSVAALAGGVADVSRLASEATQQSVAAEGAGSRVAVRWLALVGDTAASTHDGGTMQLEDVVARGSEGAFPFVFAGSGAPVTMDRCLIFGSGCSVSEGLVEAQDIVCVNAEGIGMASQRGGRTVVARADLSVGYGGLQTSTEGVVEATDIRIHDLGTQPIAYAIGADSGSITLERGDISRRTRGVDATNGSLVTLTDVSMHDILVTVADYGATGIDAREGATVSGSRIVIDGVEGRGVVASSSGALDLADVVLRDLSGAPGRSSGIVVADDAAPSAFSRIEIGDVAELGALFLGPAHADDLAIHDVSAGVDGAAGYGLLVAIAVDGTAPTVTGARVTLRDIVTVGLGVSGAPDSAAGRLTVTLSDLRIERAGRTAEGGAGILARGAADLTVVGLVTRDTASVGVMSRLGANITLAQGLIANTPTCTSSESPLDLTTVATDACGTAPVTWSPPER